MSVNCSVSNLRKTCYCVYKGEDIDYSAFLEIKNQTRIPPSEANAW